jgi:dTDP-4-amino-4,6-dideoxygalactose transaminase
MDPILALARQHGLKVIEDCAQAHGARYKGRPVGSMGDIGCFSFCQDKILSTGGEGGLIVANDKSVWERAWSYKDHGKSYDAVYNRQHPAGFRWLHESVGTNWRLTEPQSAIGRVLLRKLDGRVEQRRRNVNVLAIELAKVPALRVPQPPPDFFHAYYKFYAYLRTELLQAGWDIERINTAINAEGVPAFSGSCSEIYLERAIEQQYRPPERHRVARSLGDRSLMFLVHQTLADQDMLDTAAAVRKVLSVAAPNASQRAV